MESLRELGIRENNLISVYGRAGPKLSVGSGTYFFWRREADGKWRVFHSAK